MGAGTGKPSAECRCDHSSVTFQSGGSVESSVCPMILFYLDRNISVSAFSTVFRSFRNFDVAFFICLQIESESCSASWNRSSGCRPDQRQRWYYCRYTLLRKARRLPLTVLIKAFSFRRGRLSIVAVLARHCRKECVIADQMTDLQFTKDL